MSIARKIIVPSKTKTAAQQKETQERYFVRLVRDHPHYRTLINALKEGVKATEIASHFAENGWLHVNERTFTEAIRVYKSRHPEAIEMDHNLAGLDKQVDPNVPGVDIEQQLQQLLRLQRARIGMLHKFELDTSIPGSQMQKEIEVTNKLIETLGKLKGKITDAGHRPMAGEDHSVVENLNRIKRDQTTRDRLHSAVKQLVEVKGG